MPFPFNSLPYPLRHSILGQFSLGINDNYDLMKVSKQIRHHFLFHGPFGQKVPLIDYFSDGPRLIDGQKEILSDFLTIYFSPKTSFQSGINLRPQDWTLFKKIPSCLRMNIRFADNDHDHQRRSSEFQFFDFMPKIHSLVSFKFDGPLNVLKLIFERLALEVTNEFELKLQDDQSSEENLEEVDLNDIFKSGVGNCEKLIIHGPIQKYQGALMETESKYSIFRLKDEEKFFESVDFSLKNPIPSRYKESILCLDLIIDPRISNNISDREQAFVNYFNLKEILKGLDGVEVISPVISKEYRIFEKVFIIAQSRDDSQVITVFDDVLLQSQKEIFKRRLSDGQEIIYMVIQGQQPSHLSKFGFYHVQLFSKLIDLGE